MSLINNGFLLDFVTTTCCICFLPNMSIGQTGKQPAQFCPWLFWQKTCPQMAKYKVMGTIMVITIDYLAARTKQCGIVRSILWLRVHQIYSKNEKGHDLRSWWLHLLLAMAVISSMGDSRIEQLNFGIGAHYRNSHFEFELPNSRTEQMPTLLGRYLQRIWSCTEKNNLICGHLICNHLTDGNEASWRCYFHKLCAEIGTHLLITWVTNTQRNHVFFTQNKPFSCNCLNPMHLT